MTSLQHLGLIVQTIILAWIMNALASIFLFGFLVGTLIPMDVCLFVGSDLAGNDVCLGALGWLPFGLQRIAYWGMFVFIAVKIYQDSKKTLELKLKNEKYLREVRQKK